MSSLMNCRGSLRRFFHSVGVGLIPATRNRRRWTFVRLSHRPHCCFPVSAYARRSGQGGRRPSLLGVPPPWYGSAARSVGCGRRSQEWNGQYADRSCRANMIVTHCHNKRIFSCATWWTSASCPDGGWTAVGRAVILMGCGCPKEGIFRLAAGYYHGHRWTAAGLDMLDGCLPSRGSRLPA